MRLFSTINWINVEGVTNGIYLDIVLSHQLHEVNEENLELYVRLGQESDQ
jgi:hypothetical protein